jgi:hypothetical protein
MEVLGQSTKTVTQPPYVHLGYTAASNLFFPVGILLVLIGAVQAFTKKKRYMVASILAIVIGVLFMVFSIAVFIEMRKH